MPGLLQLPLELVFSGQTSFENFVWEANQHALQHQLLMPFKSEQAQFTWLWGRPGVGKSHLLQALAQRETEAIYLPAARLLNFESNVLQTLQACPFLILDDVHLLCGLGDWEEQVFIICQHMLQTRGCLWFSASAPPTQLPFNLKDLQSRLQLALIYEVHELSEQGKAKALTTRAHQRGIELREDVIQFLLARNQRNMHDLLAMLDQLDVHALAEQRKITIPFIKAVFGW